ncbi:MAG TPA: hypothetical protein VN520_12615 [Streptomyces sp.]|uniref:hypothetical protein n=1 Tax=Streptomyces sp. TaxID=1931 RepID=UPI002BF3F376|nr:hypothetical protein [Streptomyces sp.]HWU07203.1 hypothetical protein [Streptomyces sp.]
MPRTALDPLFTATDASTGFTDRHLAHLASGTLAAVRVPRFLDSPVCTNVLSGLERVPTADYDPVRVPPPIVRFGPARPGPPRLPRSGRRTGRERVLA